MKPWYCKTKGYTPQQIQDAFDLCVNHGVYAHYGIDRSEKENIYKFLYHKKYISYFGVNESGATYLHSNTVAFGSSAVEITLDQLPAHLVIETPEEKEAFEAMSKASEQKPKDKSQLLNDVCESLFGEVASQCRDDVVSTIEAMIDGGWVKERGNE